MQRYLLLVILFLLVPPASAHSVTIPTTTYFLIDGTYKNFPKELTFDAVYRTNGTWYFDGKTYDEVLQDLAGFPAKYILNVFVLKDNFPIIATVTINGENQTTQLLGLTTWLLPYGTYTLTASLQGFPSQTTTILLNQNTTETFNFVTPPQSQTDPFEWVSIILLALGATILYLVVFRIRQK